MTEFDQPTEAAESAQPGASLSAGQMLRNLRESAGVELVVLASAMKVSPQMLHALETDHLNQLPDVTFARGLAASICRAFGVDPAVVLERMPTAMLELNPLKPALNTPLRRSGQSQAGSWLRNVPRWLLIVVGLLLLGSVVLWLWPTLPIRLGAQEAEQIEQVLPPAELDEQLTPLVPGLQSLNAPPTPASPPESMVTPSGAAPTTATETSSSSDFALAKAQEEANEAAKTNAEEQGASLLAADNTDMQSTAEDSEADQDPDAEGVQTRLTAAAEASGASAEEQADIQALVADEVQAALLELTAQDESWVSVHDAGGTSLLNRTLQAGESVSVEGAEPLAVVIGRKDAVQVKVRGESFDHLALVQGRATVARFQVQ